MSTTPETPKSYTARRYHSDDCPHERGDLVQIFTATVTRWYNADLNDLPTEPREVIAQHGHEEIANHGDNEWYFECRDCGTLVPLRMTDADVLARKEV